MKKRILSMLLALTMLLSLVPTAVFANTGSTAEGPDKDGDGEIVYVSLGDSTTNGYGLDGYELTTEQFEAAKKKAQEEYAKNPTEFLKWQELNDDRIDNDSMMNMNGLLMQTPEAYPAQFAQELRDATGKKVNLIQLAVSAFRADEVSYLLQYDITKDQNNGGDVGRETVGDKYSANNSHDKYANLNYTGHVEALPFDILLGNGSGGNSPYADPYEMQSLAMLYQKSIENAEVISINLGSNNFSVYIMGALKYFLGINDEIGYEPVTAGLLATLENDPELKEMAENARALYAKAMQYMMAELAELGTYDTLLPVLKNISNYCEYTFLSFCVNYERILDHISAVNPTADVIIMPATNYMSGFKLTTDEGTVIDMSKYIGYTLDLANAYVTSMAAEKKEMKNNIYVGDAGVDVDTFMDQLVARVNDPDVESVFAGYGILRKRMINGIGWLAYFMDQALKAGGYNDAVLGVATTLDVNSWVTVPEIEKYEEQGYTWEGDAKKERLLAYYIGMEKAMIKTLEKDSMSAEAFSDLLVSHDLYTSIAKLLAPAGVKTNQGGTPDEIAATLYESEKAMSILYFLDYFWVADGVMCHPSDKGYDAMTEALEKAYLVEDKTTVAEGADKKTKDLMVDGYFFLKDDEMFGTAEKLEMIDMFAKSLKEEITQDEDVEKALQTLSDLNAYLSGNGYIGKQETLDIILSVYAALLKGMTERDIKDVALFIYNTLTGEKEAKPVVYSTAGSSSSGSTALTAAKKLEIINGVYGILDGADYMTDVAQLDDMKAIFEKLEADEEAAVEVFETLLYGVLEPETAADIDVAGITASVYNTVMSSNIPADKKMEIIEDVADLLAESQLGEMTGLPTDKLGVVKKLREALKDYFTAEQLGVIIADISALIMDGSMTELEKAQLADNLHNNYLFGRDDLTAADKAEIIMIVYSVLEEEGLVESAVVGALAYAYLEAVNKGYLDAAIKGLQIAQGAIGTAKDYVNKKVPAEYAAIRDLMIEELDNTAETLSKLEALLAADPATVSVADLLALEDDLWAHLDTLKDLGLAAGVEIDPYLKKINKAVVEFNAAVEGIIDEAYAIISAVKSFPEAYAAWVESVGAKVDAISPELGALVRKYLNDNAADAMAILAVYGEEAVTKLVAEAVAAYGEIADVVMELFYVLSVYGEDIYAAIENNPEVDRLVEAVKAQLAEAKELVEWIDEHPFEGAYNAVVADKQAALDAVYAELAIHYNELSKILASVIEDVDPIAAEALSDAVAALCKAMGITYDAAEGYIGWLADHADAMACELLCALLENTWEFICAASPVVDQVMYDWLYNNPETVIAFFVENGAEIEALIEKYGPSVLGVIAYIGATYGPEVLDFIIENPCEALDMFMDWYNKYGYRIWPMIDVYLEALGVYDAIDEQLEAVKAMLSELDAHILAQIAALKAALLDASEELRAQIEAEIQALYEQLMAFLKANISAYYVVGPNSYYVALGDAGAYGPAADKLAAELGMSDKYANLTFADASASEVLANLNAAEIAKADLVTLGFGANTFTAAVAADVMNAAFGEIVAKDWAALVGEEGAAAIEAALVELTAYVAEEVEDEAVAALLTAAVESFAYTYINHLVDYVVVSEAIHEINADALLVLVGMHNPMDGVVIDLDGEQLDLGEYLNYLVMLTNIYSFGYALIAEDTIYVDAPAVETNYDGAVMDIMTFVSDLLGFEEAVVKYQPTDAGYEYIQEQIYNALNPTLYEEEACQHGKLGTVKFQWAGDYSTCVAVYVCPDCGAAFTKDCLVTVETVNPTVEKEGLMTYTATVEFFGTTYTDEQTVTLAKLPAPDTGDTAMVGLYVTVMMVAAAGAVVVLKKKKHA